jgi:hypothetical protein
VGDRQTDRLALIFYVDHKSEGPERVPATIEFKPSGHDHAVQLATDVVETPAVEPEA